MTSLLPPHDVTSAEAAFPYQIAGPGATNLLEQVRGSRSFSPDINRGSAHGSFNVTFRQNVVQRSLQLSFTPDGRRLDADIDFFNPNKIPGEIAGHIFEVFSHKLSRLFGAGGKTNPYNVAYRSSWECK